MATFGSLSLLIALALAAYNLLAGTIALRMLATAGRPAPAWLHGFGVGLRLRVSPERLADAALESPALWR